MNVMNPVQNRELFFERIKQANPAKTAVIDLGGGRPISLTYGELDELANRAAHGLRRLGVGPGDNVAYLLPNGWEFVAVTLAIWKLGASACPMLPALREREITFIMGKSKSRVLIIPDEYRGFAYPPLIESIRSDLHNLESLITVTTRDPADRATCLGGLAANDADPEELAAFAPGFDSNAQLLFTSGTTGEPKGVIHTHGTLSYGIQSHVRTLRLTAEDVIWIPSPMAHQTGFLYGMILALYLGATQVCQAKWSVDTAREAIETHGATFVQAAMPFLADMMRVDNPPQGLKVFVATGAAVPRQLAYESSVKLNCKVVGGWGSTESCLVTVNSPYDENGKPWGSDGRCIEGMSIKITDDQNRSLPAGTEGLFKVKTPAMFTEYLDHPEWYADAVDSEGYFKTGDLAYIDEEGYLHLTGRTKDVINRGGVKIPVVELENLLYQHENVLHAAVVAMPDPRLNERICAYAVPKDTSKGLTLEEVTDFMRARGVTKIYWPERLELIESMPMTVTGKVQKFVLRQWIQEKIAREEQGK